MRRPRRALLERPTMTSWYAPLQLLRTGRDVAISTLFGESDDRRLFQKLAWQEYAFFDLRARSSIGIDYVADTGDGFDSTYAVLHWLTRPKLVLGETETSPGELLVFGGDQVYPTPVGSAYEERLVAPMQMACGEKHPKSKNVDDGPWLFAIPGNHDWYDNLASFTHLFLTKKTFCGWHVPQRRSYFAIALPHDWWLLGTDVQLASDIDDDQMEFFRSVGAKMDDNAKVILCNAEPHWVYEHETRGKKIKKSNLADIEETLGHEIRVWIAGDLHHYRRFANEDGVQKITAGGGGAFLHPTHGWKEPPLEGGFEHQKSFPDLDTSRALTRWNLLFPWFNRSFGWFTAALYVIVGWNMLTSLRSNPVYPESAFTRLSSSALTTPSGATWCIFVLAGFILFTDTSKLRHRIIGGGLHGLAHFLTIITGVYVACALQWKLDLEFQSLAHVGLCVGILVVLGLLIAPLWMGVYLYISLNWSGRHRNEAFSSLRIPDWKNFLRMRIDETGALTILPVGIERVPRKWKSKKRTLVPDDPSATEPELIEDPIVVR